MEVEESSNCNNGVTSSSDGIKQENADDEHIESQYVEQTNPSNKEGKNRFYGYLIDCIMRDCDELYQICLSEPDTTLCLEISSFLQNVAYDFVTLDEWRKLKTLCKELPLPERKNSAPGLNYDTEGPKGRNISGVGDAYSNAPKQELITDNSSAPYVIPASSKTRDKPLLNDKSVQTSWVFQHSLTDLDSTEPNSSHQTENNSYNSIRYTSSYIDTPQEYEYAHNGFICHDYERPQSSSFCNSLNFPPVPQGIYSYSPATYQPIQSVSHQYVPHFHVPYPLFHQDINTNMMRNAHASRQPNFSHADLHRAPRFLRGHRYSQASGNKHSKQKAFIKKHARYEDGSMDTQMLAKEDNASCSSPKEDLPPPDVKISQGDKPSGGHKECEAQSTSEKVTVESITNDFNSVLNTSQPIKKESPNKQNIFGLAEDQCHLHFPELTSEHQKKGKSRSSFLGSEKKNLEPKTLLDIDVKTEPIYENSSEKGASFSEVIKTSTQAVGEPSPDLTTCHSMSISKHQSKTKPSPNEKQSNLKKLGLEEWLEEESCISAPLLLRDNNCDADGWKVVKARSKWRDSGELKHSRQQVNRGNKSYNTQPQPRHESNFRNFASILTKYMEENTAMHDMDTLKKTDTSRSIMSGIPDSSHPVSVDSTDECKIETADDLNCENHSHDGCYSSENSHELSLNQSEGTSPSDLKFMEEIDPNEMYYTYMKYLSNVEQEGSDSGSKPAEKILHPQTDGVTSINPASLEEMTDFVNKDPIRALDFKNKLDDKIKHQEDVKRKNEAKQQLAYKKRLQFLHDKSAKFKGLVQKIKEVKAAHDQLALQRKNRIDLKLKKAEEKRRMHLTLIKRKAHDEEEKLKEIAFINELAAQNRLHDILALRQEHEERLQYLVEERQRKHEEKAAKEAAVEERRKALEAERKEKLELIKEKRRRKEEFIDRKQQEKEQERLVIAREKAREREERLQAIHSAQLANLEELQKRIQQKQEESQKRHIECIELIRQKAIEIGLCRNNTDGSANHIAFYKHGESLNGDNTHDKCKLVLKKRLKKIKSRMVVRGNIYIEETHRNDKDLSYKETISQKLMKKLMMCELDKTHVWLNEDIDSVDHCLDEILLYIQEEPKLSDELKDIKAFIYFESVISTFNYSSHQNVSRQVLRCIIKIITIYDLSCLDSSEISLYIVLSNILATLLDSLKISLQAIELPSKSWGLIVELLLRFHSVVIDSLNRLPEDALLTIPDFSTRMKDLISYILYSGLVNKLSDLFRLVIVDEKRTYDSLLVASILFFKRLLCSWFISDELIDVLKSTELFGIVPFLYEGLTKQISNDNSLPEYCMPTIKLFLKLAETDLTVFQEILGAENIALQWRGIASGLMTYCVSKNDCADLLNILIKLVGYFAIHNKNNQTLLQSGKQPTVLQQLVNLPFQYFCDPEFMEVLFPTLISCSYNNATNRAIVENEVDYNGLEKFMKSDVGKNNKIIKLLVESCL